MKTTKVLVVATSHKTRGGVTSVVKAHQKGNQWKDYHCKWIETHIDRSLLLKLLYLIKSFVLYLCILPFYDIVHIHLSEPVSAFRKVPFVVWARLWKKRIIVHFHAFSPESTVESKHKSVYKFIFSKADSVVVLSQLWKQFVNNAFNLGEKVRVIYNPCTLEVSKQAYRKKKQILYAGTVNARKGYVDMIKAFAIIAKENPEWKIVFAGNGDIDNGKKIAKELGIDAQTVFLGWVNGNVKDRVFKESEIFCLPSYAEGFPMAVLDAWAYGLPVITTPVGGIPDFAKDEENMLLFNPGDVSKLAEQIQRMIAETDLREKIIKESILFAQSTFCIDTINKQVRDLYKDISSKSR